MYPFRAKMPSTTFRLPAVSPVLKSRLSPAVIVCWFALLLAAAGPGSLWASEARPPIRRQPVNVVLVHGFLNTGKIFNPLVKVLSGKGYTCLAPSLSPNDCRHGVDELAQQLSRDIDARFGPAQPIFLVGFSMGGLITRDYVQNIAARRRIRGVFLISAPNHGTLLASLAPFGRIKELSFHSPFTRELNSSTAAWENIPVRSYWTPYDLMIVPYTSSRWPVGDARQISCLLHPWMPRNREVMADIAAHIAIITAASRAL